MNRYPLVIFMLTTPHKWSKLHDHIHFWVSYHQNFHPSSHYTIHPITNLSSLILTLHLKLLKMRCPKITHPTHPYHIFIICCVLFFPNQHLTSFYFIQLSLEMLFPKQFMLTVTSSFQGFFFKHTHRWNKRKGTKGRRRSGFCIMYIHIFFSA